MNLFKKLMTVRTRSEWITRFCLVFAIGGISSWIIPQMQEIRTFTGHLILSVTIPLSVWIVVQILIKLKVIKNDLK